MNSAEPSGSNTLERDVGVTAVQVGDELIQDGGVRTAVSDATRGGH
jgi:hypothetical protein